MGPRQAWKVKGMLIGTCLDPQTQSQGLELAADEALKDGKARARRRSRSWPTLMIEGAFNFGEPKPRTEISKTPEPPLDRGGDRNSNQDSVASNTEQVARSTESSADTPMTGNES
jgi:hypothetical protein